MAETSNMSEGAGIDLSQFFQVFFEEAGENLDDMKQMLLNLDVLNADDEELNAIFRCAHSVKGGAATFGCTDMAELAHQMETLLDKLRRRDGGCAVGLGRRAEGATGTPPRQWR
jgi:two-component system, chemotaxis family, sensor kinase CheA